MSVQPNPNAAGSHRPGRAALAAAISVLALFASLAFSLPASAEPLGDLEIVEGQGLGDVLTLGMGRSDVIATQAAHDGDNGNCHSGSTCTFRLSADTAAITVAFDVDTVERITFNQNSVATQWATTAGATDSMSLDEVAALYPGAEQTATGVIAADRGYTFTATTSCTYFTCTRTVTHDVYPADATNPQGELSPEFVGAIVVENPLRKTKTFTLEIDITDPSGSVTSHSLRQSIPGNGSVSLDPGAFVDVHGPVGTYGYEVDLTSTSRKRTRLVGTSTGSFDIVMS